MTDRSLLVLSHTRLAHLIAKWKTTLLHTYMHAALQMHTYAQHLSIVLWYIGVYTQGVWSVVTCTGCPCTGGKCHGSDHAERTEGTDGRIRKTIWVIPSMWIICLEWIYID